MADYTDVIEKFLKGQMNQQEEARFRNKMRQDNTMIRQAIALVILIKSLRNRAH